MRVNLLVFFFFFFATPLFSQNEGAGQEIIVGLDQDEPVLIDESVEEEKNFFKMNREDLRGLMPARSVALVFSGVEKVRSNDVNFPFHQDPDFYYLTGFNEPDALLILFKEAYEIDNELVSEIMFVPGKSKEYEMWHGNRMGTAGVKSNLGFSHSYTNTEFPDFNIRFNFFDKILYNIKEGVLCDDPRYRGDIASLMKHFLFKTDSLKRKLDDQMLSSRLSLLREIKKDLEIEKLSKAIDITCKAHSELMKQIDTSFAEYKAQALVEYEFRSNGGDGPGFPSIVGGGANTCVLHYTANNSNLKDGDLLVVDIGAQYRHYSADVTRTIPVNGKFSEEQRLIYDLVLKAQDAGIAKCVQGNKFWDPHDAATEVIQKGLKNLGIIKKEYEAKKYFMHGTSHYLGLDVHDAGSYQPLRVNNLITVEPGIYIPEGSDCDKKWWNIGIRIEDDILITSQGPQNLSDCTPREIIEIEALMAQ